MRGTPNANGDRLSGKILRNESDTLVTSGETLTSAPIPMAKLRFINPSAEISGEGVKVSGHLNAGLSSSSGNTDAKKFYLDTETVARTSDNRYTLGARAARTEDRGIETGSNWIGYMQVDHFITKKWYGYANGNIENDKALLLTLGYPW